MSRPCCKTDADDAALAKLAELTERYCVVAQSLGQLPSLTITQSGVIHMLERAVSRLDHVVSTGETDRVHTGRLVVVP